MPVSRIFVILSASLLCSGCGPQQSNVDFGDGSQVTPMIRSSITLRLVADNSLDSEVVELAQHAEQFVKNEHGELVAHWLRIDPEGTAIIAATFTQPRTLGDGRVGLVAKIGNEADRMKAYNFTIKHLPEDSAGPFRRLALIVDDSIWSIPELRSGMMETIAISTQTIDAASKLIPDDH